MAIGVSWSISDMEEEMAKITAEREDREKQVEDLKTEEEAFRIVLRRLANFSSADRPTSPELLEAIYRKLVDEGEPVHRKQILSHVQALGLHIRGQDPMNNMTAHMSNDARFESTKGVGMWGPHRMDSWQGPERLD